MLVEGLVRPFRVVYLDRCVDSRLGFLDRLERSQLADLGSERAVEPFHLSVLVKGDAGAVSRCVIPFRRGCQLLCVNAS